MSTQTAKYQSFANAIEKNGASLECLLPVYRKCFSGNIRLQGDEYAMGMELKDIGFMAVSYSPIWKNGSYRGQSVTFTSIDPEHY